MTLHTDSHLVNAMRVMLEVVGRPMQHIYSRHVCQTKFVAAPCSVKGTLARKNTQVFFGPIPQRKINKEYYQYTSSNYYLRQKSC